MTETDIDKAVEGLLKNKPLKNKLGIDFRQAYELRHRSGIATKLELLYNAGYLQINEPTQPQITTK